MSETAGEGQDTWGSTVGKRKTFWRDTRPFSPPPRSWCLLQHTKIRLQRKGGRLPHVPLMRNRHIVRSSHPNRKGKTSLSTPPINRTPINHITQNERCGHESCVFLTSREKVGAICHTKKAWRRETTGERNSGRKSLKDRGDRGRIQQMRRKSNRRRIQQCRVQHSQIQPAGFPLSRPSEAFLNLKAVSSKMMRQTNALPPSRVSILTLSIPGGAKHRGFPRTFLFSNGNCAKGEKGGGREGSNRKTVFSLK